MGLHSNLGQLHSRPIHSTDIVCRSTLSLAGSLPTEQEADLPSCAVVPITLWLDVAKLVFFPDYTLGKIPL